MCPERGLAEQVEMQTIATEWNVLQPFSTLQGDDTYADTTTHCWLCIRKVPESHSFWVVGLLVIIILFLSLFSHFSLIIRYCLCNSNNNKRRSSEEPQS